MIYRLWTTGVDPTQLERYREFARSRSLPMLRGSTSMRRCRTAVDSAYGPNLGLRRLPMPD